MSVPAKNPFCISVLPHSFFTHSRLNWPSVCTVANIEVLALTTIKAGGRMVMIIEKISARRWLYVRASGTLDYWEEEVAPEIGALVNEASQLGLEAVLWDGRNVCGEVGLKKAVGNFYLLRKQLKAVRLAYVVAENLFAPFGFVSQVAKMDGTPIRTFRSVIGAARWLCPESRKRRAALIRGSPEIATQS